MRRTDARAEPLTHVAALAVCVADYKFKTIEHSGKRVKLQIWDTAGQERFTAMTTRYYRMAAGILLVYDVTDRGSFTNVENWMQSIHEHGDPSCQVVIVANKVDCAAERIVSTEEGRQCADKYGAPFFEGSARTGENVETAFLQLAAAALGSSALFVGGGEEDAGSGGLDLADAQQNAGGGCAC
jgi:small GTP-binding protein